MLELKVQFSCHQKFNFHSPVLSTNQLNFLPYQTLASILISTLFIHQQSFSSPHYLHITAHFGMLPD